MMNSKKCIECNKVINFVSVGPTSTYCGESCRALKRQRVQKECKMRSKARALVDLDYCANKVFKTYRRRAPARGLVFDLTLKHFRDNIEKPCYYCQDMYEGIGLDRIDNEQGYIPSNIVPCCTICNMMKRNSSLESFLDRCMKITKCFSTVDM